MWLADHARELSNELGPFSMVVMIIEFIIAVVLLWGAWLTLKLAMRFIAFLAAMSNHQGLSAWGKDYLHRSYLNNLGRDWDDECRFTLPNPHPPRPKPADENPLKKGGSE